MKKLTFYLSLVQTVLILLLLNNISKAQTSFNISNQTTGDTLFTIDNTGRVGIGLTVPDAGLHVSHIDGILFTGTLNSGSIPASGTGMRLMWYPRKAAFRAGYVNGTQWDDLSIGTYSVAIGWNTAAGGDYSSIGGFKFPDGTVQASAAGGGVSSINDLSDGKTGGSSVFLGSGAGANDDGMNNYNTAVGINALYSNLNGSFNTANGYSALHDNTTGSNNVGLGFEANRNNLEGSQNTIIGSQAGRGNVLHNKSGNVFLGFHAGFNETGNNKLYIENSNSSSPLIWGDFLFNHVVINGNSSHNTLNRTFFCNGIAGGTTAWYNDSDIRLKKNIETISNTLERVKKLRGVNYEWKNTENRSEGLQMGFIAQEANDIIPEVVDDSGEYYSMQYAPITALLVEAVKEQQEIIKNQETRTDDGVEIAEELRVVQLDTSAAWIRI